mmetsp:Transcript_28742/g.39727  ORF Transcript_28742/g.39727 Transcript_28742/m.39727 type:complete len:115 (+) Transcript_28742:265-609(+)|eukprot:CAMPEP_0196580460 /NCGR_PEP_ID=MMETSP1081-20130531/28643_1 /TAXON_ID=36882 /ORGANISM="Pyramimonas amylifera, Strain CCMP720" /LENGTH=114 /DNA_ID=CAMNT_0041900325 /DNA_START=264 /DNA_END=608 /DNA_ORIENTATION=+
MWVESWDVFYQQAEQLFRAEPLRTRFVTKYRHCDGKLEVKVTDDRVCLKYKTDQAQDLKKLEKLNQLFFVLTVHGKDAAVADFVPETASTTSVQHQSRPGTATQGGKKGRGRRQ